MLSTQKVCTSRTLDTSLPSNTATDTDNHISAPFLDCFAQNTFFAHTSVKVSKHSFDILAIEALIKGHILPFSRTCAQISDIWKALLWSRFCKTQWWSLTLTSWLTLDLGHVYIVKLLSQDIRSKRPLELSFGLLTPWVPYHCPTNIFYWIRFIY